MNKRTLGVNYSCFQCYVHVTWICINSKQEYFVTYIPQEVVRNKTMKTIFQTIILFWSCKLLIASPWRYQQPVRQLTITILLSWKLKLCKKKRHNMWNNRSPYLQCQPCWSNHLAGTFASVLCPVCSQQATFGLQSAFYTRVHIIPSP